MFSSSIRSGGTMSRLPVSFLVFGLMIALVQTGFAAEPTHLKLYTVQGKFDTVRGDVELAITGHGLVIDHVSHIGAMLERTGKDLGATKKVFDKAESLLFCSASVSRHTMEADPTNVVFCPYGITVYTLPQDPKTVYVGYRRPVSTAPASSKAALKEVEDLLDGIVREALNLK
jgi:uncharacterized protein (DUF302 family)